MTKILSISLWLLLSLSLSAQAQDEALQAKLDNEARNFETMRLWGDEVWGKGRLELVPNLVAPQYVRHSSEGTRVVTPESYAKEIEESRKRSPKFVANAQSTDGDLVWVLWSLDVVGDDGQPIRGRGIQVYRLEDAKLAETWWLSQMGEHWPDR